MHRRPHDLTGRVAVCAGEELRNEIRHRRQLWWLLRLLALPSLLLMSLIVGKD